MFEPVEKLTAEQAKKKYGTVWVVSWGDTYISYEEAHQRSEQAKKLARDVKLYLITTERRNGFEGEEYSESVPNWMAVAQLLEKAKLLFEEERRVK